MANGLKNVQLRALMDAKAESKPLIFPKTLALLQARLVVDNGRVLVGDMLVGGTRVRPMAEPDGAVHFLPIHMDPHNPPNPFTAHPAVVPAIPMNLGAVASALELPTWRDRLRWKLFPAKAPEVADADFQATGTLMTDVRITLDWRDRIRALFTGKLVVKTNSMCEHRPGRVLSVSVVWVDGWKWLQRKQ